MDDEQNILTGIKKIGKSVGNFLKKAGKRYAKIALVGLLVFILLAALFWGVIDEAFKKLSDAASDLKNVVEIQDKNIIIPDDFKEQIQKRLDAVGLNAEELNLGGNLEYLTNWMEAEIVTSYPEMGGDGLQGVITVKRGNTDGTSTQLTYAELQDFRNMITNQNADAKKYFAMDGENFVIAKSNIAADGTTTLEEYKFNYMMMVSSYSTPFEFFVALCLITQSPEFVNALANYTKNTTIEITILESLTTTTTTTQITGKKTVSTYTSTGGVATEPTVTTTDYAEDPVTEVSYFTAITPIVTEARTLFVEKTVEPIFTDKTLTPDPIVTDEPDQLGTYTLIDRITTPSTGGNSTSTTTVTTYTYQKVDLTENKRTVTTTTHYQTWQAGTTSLRDNTDAFLGFIVNNTGELPGGVAGTQVAGEEVDISQVTGFARTILEKAAECKQYVANNGFTYGPTGNIPVSGTNGTIDCSGYVSWVMYEAGYKATFAGHQKTVTSFFVNTPPADWQVITNFDAIQPGDLIIMKNNSGDDYGHIQIYAGGDKHYNCGYTGAIQQPGATSSSRCREDFNFALRPTEPSEEEQNGTVASATGSGLTGATAGRIVEGNLVLYKVPPTMNYQSPKENLVTGAELLFKLLGSNQRTQIYETVMRYILYRLTGRSYGVTSLDLSIFGTDSFNNASVGGLAGYLRQFSHADGEAPQSTDGKYYLMYGDGVGWPTIGNADIQWKSHHNKFNKQGKVLENGQEITVDSVEEYVGTKLPRGHDAKYTNAEVASYQIYIEKELVDSVGEENLKHFLNTVDSATAGLNLSMQQRWALTAIVMNFGHMPVRDGRTFKQVYEAASGLYEVNSWEHNRYVWDNWWCKLGGGAPGHIPSRDATFETYVKGIYDYSQSPAGEVFGRTKYIYYTAAQLAQFSYAPNKPITRTAANEQEIFTYVEKSGGTVGSTDISGYSFRTYTSSNGKTYTWYLQNYGPWVNEVSSGGSTMAAAGCYCTSASIVGSGYGNTRLPGWGRNIYEYNLTSRHLGAGCPGGVVSQLSSNQLSEIQNHLRNGGEVIVHVQGSGRGGTSRYTSNQHWMPLVDINQDGSQVFNMNTTKGTLDTDRSGWVDIRDVFTSVNCYHLINGIK